MTVEYVAESPGRELGIRTRLLGLMRCKVADGTRPGTITQTPATRVGAATPICTRRRPKAVRSPNGPPRIQFRIRCTSYGNTIELYGSLSRAVPRDAAVPFAAWLFSCGGAVTESADAGGKAVIVTSSDATAATDSSEASPGCTISVSDYDRHCWVNSDWIGSADSGQPGVPRSIRRLLRAGNVPLRWRIDQHVSGGSIRRRPIADTNW